MWRWTLSLAVVATAAVGCQRGATQEEATSPGPGADSPVSAVEELVELVGAADFDEASDLAVPGQAALASFVEGATFSQVAAAIDAGDSAVAANFWAGFAQGAGGFLTDSVTSTAGQIVTEGGVEFHTVNVTLEDGADRFIYTRDLDGHRIDLFASFGPGLADKMIPPVERLISGQSDDAAIILRELNGIVPSLLVAANQPGMSPQSIQDLLRLVELITRVN